MVDFTQFVWYTSEIFTLSLDDRGDVVGFGASCIVGNSKDGSVRLGLFYSDPFIRSQEQFDTIPHGSSGIHCCNEDGCSVERWS